MNKAFELSHRLKDVNESATLKLNTIAQNMLKEGVDLINLTTGEPDFPAPRVAKEAILLALEQNQSKYTPAAGHLVLRESIAQKTNFDQPSLQKTHSWKAQEVVVTNGGKQGLFNACLALLNANDEVLIPAPYWISYPEIVKICEAKPVILPTTMEQGFKITADQLRQACHSRTRLFILNSPSNPTGVLYTKAELRAFGEVLKEFPNVWILSDEIYDRITYTDEGFVSFLEACPELWERTITCSGLSKTGAMTGWRIGWTVAPLSLTQGMSSLQGQSTSGINALAQAAAIATLKALSVDLKSDSDLSEFKSHLVHYRRRRSQALEILKRQPKLQIFEPQGAFYFFIGFKHFFKPGEDSVGFAERLMKEALVAGVPGTPFGARDFLRFSFATDEKKLFAACERILSYCNH